MREYLLVLSERGTADEIASDLTDEGLDSVRVVRIELAGEDDAEAAEWGVYVIVESDGAGETDLAEAPHGLGRRFEELAAEHDGWYDPDPSRWGSLE